MTNKSEFKQETGRQEDFQSPTKTGRKVNLVLAAVASFLLLVAGQMLYKSFGSYAKGIAALQYKAVDARVVKVEEHFDPLGIRKEALIGFQVNGQEKTALVDLPQERVMKQGELTSIYYDPNRTDSAVLTQEIDYDPIIVLGAFGLFIFCFGALMAKKSLPCS